MDRLALKAEERKIFGKQVKKLRREGIIPAHVFGKKIPTEHILVKEVDFNKVYTEAGETGLIDLKIGGEKIRPVLVRDVQLDPIKDNPLHIDFYQVNLTEKVKVAVPVVLVGEEPELVHSGEAVVIQPISEVEVEALPTDLPEKIEVDITSLKQINDALLVSQLPVPEGVALIADPEAVVVKLDKAITGEMEKLLEEERVAAEAAAIEVAPKEEVKVPAEGEETPAFAEATAGELAEGGEEVEVQGQTEEKPAR